MNMNMNKEIYSLTTIQALEERLGIPQTERVEHLLRDGINVESYIMWLEDSVRIAERNMDTETPEETYAAVGRRL